MSGEGRAPAEAAGGAVPQVPGEDGKVLRLFPAGGQAGPKLRGDGTTDFRETEALVQAKAGTPLARLQPPGPGIPGCDAHGNPVPAPPGKPAQFLPCPGTRISDDGQTLAACDGAVSERNGAISVSAVLEPADGGKEFLISKEKGLIDRSAPRVG